MFVQKTVQQLKYMINRDVMVWGWFQTIDLPLEEGRVTVVPSGQGEPKHKVCETPVIFRSVEAFWFLCAQK